jgi:hypothetical protein
MLRGEVFAKFVDPEILGEQGRLLFSIVNAFATAGYRVWLFDDFPQDALGKYGRLTYSIDGVRLTRAAPPDTADMIYLYDRPDRTLEAIRWRKRVHVQYDIFARYWFETPIVMPFPLHPAHARSGLAQRLEKARSTPRRMRLFFAGDIKGYEKNRIRYPAEKLARAAVVDVLRRRMGRDVLELRESRELDALLSSSEYVDKCILLDIQSFRVDEHRWLEAVASADFFLCPPGYVMPMCHNAIEALAVGAVPLTNYPEWFNPPLRDMENCVAFTAVDDLLEKVRSVLDMGQEHIASMQARAIEYYEQYLTAIRFVNQIEASTREKITVLLISERYVARNASKLGPRSALLRCSPRALARVA